MPFPTISDVRNKLGDAYTTDPPDTIIQSFLDRRIAQVKELTGRDFSDFVPESIFKWVLYYACADVIARDLSGKDSADALEYTLAELRESKDPNVKLKLQLMELFRLEADEALKVFLRSQRSYAKYEVDPETQETVVRPTLFKRSAP
ncbi:MULTISPECIES: hypothetical protein [unclassified Archaeoglobus]|jgi:hypothetical protein|uniref:hypothetical protein n=1 Tax=unclassified Archaeoglobus TaxID=2643606 RepID=UPI0025BEADD5|nr:MULTISPECIES: hypothetical protein [unclassified Archaeoglobus]